ncbi:MAG: 1-acyl-sn-glycerol-3-phosphate acyltransferase [Bacteroidaceae bacterium]|nr:1-acyl-sn-glycerol-3-phosphate acyltransferase [Bacteroidaceae bacterium]
MTDQSMFDDIRPYRDDEIPAAMQRIAADKSFPLLASFLFPEMTVEQVREKICAFRSIYDFQYGAMAPFNRRIIDGTISEFTLGGAEKLDPSKNYLYVSNHRDIVLDSCILMYALYDHVHDTGEITFGSNLMQGQLLVDIGRSNKMFRVERGGNPRDFYNSTRHLSDYIRYALTEKKQSVWIAQRNGRTKDGIDRTDQGIIKMFGLSGSGDRVRDLAELNIVPVSVSYEWEPCDVLKALELYAVRDGEKYIKKPGEDLNSILTGITQDKGRVHFQICDPITAADLQAFDQVPNVQFHRSVAALIDRRICGSYHLFPNAYIAYDMRYGTTRFASEYSREEYSAFSACLDRLSRYDAADQDILRDIFLGIYCNPIAAPCV